MRVPTDARLMQLPVTAGTRLLAVALVPEPGVAGRNENGGVTLSPLTVTMSSLL
jgi:hypothetical protein